MQFTAIENGHGVVANIKQEDSVYSGNALHVATREGLDWSVKSIPFTDDNGGANINKDVAFSGTPEEIHDGGDNTYWTATALSGNWNFTSSSQANTGTQSIDARGTNNGAEAQLERPSGSISSSSYTFITGYVYIGNFNESNHHIYFRFRDAGVNVSNVVDMATFVDTNNEDAWLKFAIPLSLFFDTVTDFDQLIIQTASDAGGAPNYWLDDIQLEESGGTIYTAEPPAGKLFQIKSLDIVMADALDTTLLNSSMPNLSYDQILGLASLSSGVTIRRIRKNKVEFSANFRNLTDILYAGFSIVNAGCDGTNTFIKLSLDASWWIDLDANERDRIELIASDDLSGLLQFRAIARGRELVK